MDLEPIEISIKQAVLNGEFADEYEGIAEIVAYLRRRSIDEALQTGYAEMEAGKGIPLQDYMTKSLERLHNHPDR